MATLQPAWQRLARSQHGVITRAQARELGVSRKTIECHLRAGRWQRLQPGVFCTQPGTVPWLARASAAVLSAGSGAVVELEAASYLWGFRDQPPSMITVAVPESRRVVRPRGVRVRRRRRLSRHRARGLPVTSPEQTILDLADHPGCGPDEAIGLLAAAMKRRRIDVERLLTELDSRRTQRHRRLMMVALVDLGDGVESVAEYLFVDRVERPHGLPRFTRQSAAGESTRRDFELTAYGVIVEIDGYLWHGRERFHADRRRDRHAAAEGKVTLRAGWVDVTTSPCHLALEIGLTLRRRGWLEPLSACQDGCAIARQWRRHLVRKV